MVMLCYKNGSLTREGKDKLTKISDHNLGPLTNSPTPMFVDIRNNCADKSWDVFNKFLQQTQPLNGQCI